jgi:hypothetical protein
VKTSQLTVVACEIEAVAVVVRSSQVVLEVPLGTVPHAWRRRSYLNPLLSTGSCGMFAAVVHAGLLSLHVVAGELGMSRERNWCHCEDCCSSWEELSVRSRV